MNTNTRLSWACDTDPSKFDFALIKSPLVCVIGSWVRDENVTLVIFEALHKSADARHFIQFKLILCCSIVLIMLDHLPQNQSNYAYFIVYTPIFSSFTISFCLISICSGITILYMCQKRILKIDQTLQRMLSSVIISDTVFAMAFIFGCTYHLVIESREERSLACDSDPLCIAQSFMLTWAMMSSTFWCIAIEATCFAVLRNRLSVIEINRCWLWFLRVCCWGIPRELIFCFLFFFTFVCKTHTTVHALNFCK